MEPTLTAYPAARTGLVVIDVLNDFLAEGGKATPFVKEVVDGVQLVGNLQRLLAGARAAGVRVFYAPHRINAQSYLGWRYLTPTASRTRDYQMFWEGSWGADYFAALAPQPGDHLIAPHRGASAFVSTDLDAQLRQNGIEHVVLAGMAANTCVEATGRYAVEMGYHVTFLKDAVAADAWESQRAAVEVNYPRIGHAVLTIDKLLAQLDRPSMAELD
ncbi:cysteine hydrolase family protein [Hymenobacter terrenus]|uniref:cysteine hydrolase family protein n=1 Tax=Hymenobacter terrenus TaxID=1629124 RepID=UPI000619E82D|nr:isochorismatase family cysteine hydrolase [Hymenobacter terrenus]